MSFEMSVDDEMTKVKSGKHQFVRGELSEQRRLARVQERIDGEIEDTQERVGE